MVRTDDVLADELCGVNVRYEEYEEMVVSE
jgi:hypothetical protein